MAENVIYTISLNDQFTKGIKNADTETKNLDGTVNGLNSSFKALGVAAAAAFSAKVISNFVTGMIDAGTAVENARIGLTTLTKDANIASNVISETLSDAAKTPFSFEGILLGRRALIGAGISADQTRGDILALGNAIAAVGGGDSEMTRMISNMAQIATLGKASAMDIKQFGMANINIYKLLSDATGKSIEEVKEMEVSYDLLAYAFRKASQEGGIYAGGLEKMSDSTSVAISNLDDKIFKLQVQIYDKLKPAIMTVLQAVDSFITSLQDGAKWINDNIELLGWITISLIGYAMYTNAAAIGAFALTLETRLLTLAQWNLNAAMAANPYGAIILAVTALVLAIKYAWDNSEKFRGVILGLWETFKGFLKFVKEKVLSVFGGLGDIISGIFTGDTGKIKKGLSEALSAFTDLQFGVGFDAGESYDKGYEKGVKSFQDEQAAKAAGAAEDKSITDLTKPGAIPSNLLNPTKPKDKATKVDRGQKVTNININIEKLIEEFIIKTENINSATYGQIKDAVQRVMLGAVNDSQVIAGR